MAVEVVMPRLSDAMEEGTVLEWLVAEGDEVRRGQPIVEIETDKATMPFEAEADGVLLQILVGRGGTVPLGTAIARIGEPHEAVGAEANGAGSGAAAAGAPRTTPAATAAAAASPPRGLGSEGGTSTARAANGGARVVASPVARRVARALGIDLRTLQGTGPQGRVVRADVEAAAASPAGAGPATQPAPVDRPAPAEAVAATEPAPPATPRAPASPMAGGTARGDVDVHQPTRLQQTVARRMAESRATVPDFELRVDVDMGACVGLRDRLKAISTGPVPSFNDMVVKACAVALRQFPRVNGAYRDGVFERYSRINVGVAVAAQDALVVPTVTDADRRSLGEIARVTRELAGKVRDGSITPAELAGGTFTVSNLGMFGVDSFSAIINVPQSAILAVGAIRERPVVADDGRVVARPVMTLTLAWDHRILLGADGARFLSRVRSLLEQPLAFAL